QLTDWLRRSRAVRTIEIDEGWSDDRDVSVFVGRWAWLDVRALVEEHSGGKALLRISTHLRPTTFGIAAAVAFGAAALAGAITGGVAIAPSGDLFFADSKHNMIRRVNAVNADIEPFAGNADLGSGFSGDNGQALAAQLDTPNRVCIAPDGDVVVADSHNDRI